jgi:hypothetical protein
LRKQLITYGQAPRIALWIGILLLLIGLISRYLIGIRGGNSLTPSLFGLPIALLGFVALDPQYAAGAMRAVTVLALLGILVTLYVLPLLNALRLGQQPAVATAAIIASSATLVLCAILLMVCIVAFVGAWFKRVRK